ncbi:hypothetical protein JCM8547_001013 [Rhodosporidiobolus lusitaniae]
MPTSPPAAESVTADSPSRPPSSSSALVNLLDLPVELVVRILDYVEMLKNEYSESRRPNPSALHHLAYGTCRRLRSLALPRLFRHGSTSDKPARFFSLDVGAYLDGGRFVTVLRHEATQPYWPVSAGEGYEAVERLVLTFSREEKALLQASSTVEGRSAFPRLKTLELSSTSPLRFLSFWTQLPTHFTTPPGQFGHVVSALIASFGAIPLASLTIDEYASAEAVDLHTLASSFPHLKRLSLGDRMIWKGSRADLLDALSPLSSLQELSCRIFPDIPASTFRHPSAHPGLTEEDEYASPASIALEAASLLPKVSLIGFSGRQSTVEWLRVRRDQAGGPEWAEAVELYEEDLERP